MAQLPALAVLALVATGLALAVGVDWRAGTLLVGVALLLAAALRLAVPSSQAGWLGVRSRPVDAAVLLALGLAVVGLASTVPEP